MTSPMTLAASGKTAGISYSVTSPKAFKTTSCLAVGSSRSDAARFFGSLLKRALARGRSVSFGGMHDSDIAVWSELERNDDGEVIRVQVTASRTRTVRVEMPRR